jgi:hypothetical protein
MIGGGIVHRTPDAALSAGLGLGLDEIQRWAKVFVDSGMFKDARGIAQAIVKIQAGQELGLPPFAAMRGFDVIEGKPAPNAGLTSALVRRSGRYDYRVTRSDNVACVLEWLDSGRVIGESSFTLEEAKAAGLAGKQVWKAYASDMLFARALTRGARRFCADVFLGSVYTPEELGDDPIIDAVTLPATAADDPTFNGPGSFTEYTDAEFTEAPAPPPEPEHVDVASWRAEIEAATTAGAVVKLFNRIGRELADDPYRQTGAYHIAAERFVTLIPDSIGVDDIDPIIGKLRAFLQALEAVPVPSKQKCEHVRVVSLVIGKLGAMTALLPPDDHAGDMGPVTPEELEGDA